MPLKHSSWKCEGLNVVVISVSAGHWPRFVLLLTVSLLVSFLPACNGYDPFGSLPRWIRARLSTESPCAPSLVETVRAAFTLSYSYLAFPQDATFFQCEQIFFVFISQVYINKNVLLHLSVVFCGRAEGVHSLDLNSRSANLCESRSHFFFINV